MKESKAQPVRYAIGQVLVLESEKEVKKGKTKKKSEKWEITRYHKIGNHWELMIRSKVSGEHKSIPLSTLEKADSEQVV